MKSNINCKLSSTSNGNNFSFNGEFHNQRNKVVINDQSNPSELKKIRNEIMNVIDIKFNEQNKVNSAIIDMLKTIREDQKQIIKINTISQQANEMKLYDKEFLNAYYAVNGNADDLFHNLMLQKQFSLIKEYQ
jgi:hypothetical protein